MQQHSLYEKYNHTELYQTCLSAGILVRPNEAWEEMVAYLEGWKEPPALQESDNVFHTWRYGIIGFLLEFWKRIHTQITCPAKSMKDEQNPNPRPCFGCTDAQVVTCIVQNRDNEDRIYELRLVRRPKTS
jgi:hypothetical protein